MSNRRAGGGRGQKIIPAELPAPGRLAPGLLMIFAGRPQSARRVPAAPPGALRRASLWAGHRRDPDAVPAAASAAAARLGRSGTGAGPNTP